MDILLNLVVVFGLVSVGLCFIVLLPLVGQVVVSVFSTVLFEQTFSRLRGKASGTVVSAPSAVGIAPTEVDTAHEPTSTSVYVLVYIALLVLTVLTVGVSELGLLMHEAVLWAVLLASIKASLVIAWFMHVRGGPAMNRLVLSTSVFFMLVFFSLTMADLSTRALGADVEGARVIVEEAFDAGELPDGWSQPKH